MNHNDFPRRILLAVTGLTPQIVTETVYALAVAAEQKFIPTEVHVITTLEGAKRVREKLLEKNFGQFHALCREYDLPAIAFPDSHIHVIPDSAGKLMEDIRTPEDNLRAADYISHLVRNFCRDDHAALHVSIAGGRKSMGFFVGYALSLFGRIQDALSHVLVNDPFESLPDFYFPPKQGRELLDRLNSPVNTDDARIMLAEIPFVRLRGVVPESLRSGDASFAETVSGVQSGLHNVSLKFDMVSHNICCGRIWIKLPPILFAFYVWLARRCHAGLPEGGVISCTDAKFSDFRAVYAQVVGNKSVPLEKINKAWLSDEQPYDRIKPIPNRFAKGNKFFQERVAEINNLIREALPLNAHAYLIAKSGDKLYTKYGLSINPEQISLHSISR